MSALKKAFKPEFINRIDEIITFRSLSREDFTQIARIMLDELKETLQEKNVQFSYTADVASYIAEQSYSHKFGARNMRRYICRNVEDKLAEMIISDYEKQISGILLKLSDDHTLIAESF